MRSGAELVDLLSDEELGQLQAIGQKVMSSEMGSELKHLIGNKELVSNLEGQMEETAVVTENTTSADEKRNAAMAFLFGEEGSIGRPLTWAGIFFLLGSGGTYLVMREKDDTEVK